MASKYGVAMQGGDLAVPAVFVVARDRSIVFRKIGEHAADRAEVDDLLAAVNRANKRARRLAQRPDPPASKGTAASAAGATARTTEAHRVPVVGAPAPMALLARLTNPVEADAFLASLEAPGGAPLLGQLLAEAGFGTDALDRLDDATAARATRAERNLDADAATETLVHIAVTVPATAEEQSIMRGDRDTDYLIWLDGGVVGRAHFVQQPCAVTGRAFELRLEPVHAVGFDDVVVVLTEDAGSCASWVKDFVESTRVWTIERGRNEEILAHDERYSVDFGRPPSSRVQGKLELVGSPPKKARVLDAQGRVTQRLVFDPLRFAYR